jgi:hypothetical protein
MLLVIMLLVIMLLIIRVPIPVPIPVSIPIPVTHSISISISHISVMLLLLLLLVPSSSSSSSVGLSRRCLSLRSSRRNLLAVIAGSRGSSRRSRSGGCRLPALLCRQLGRLPAAAPVAAAGVGLGCGRRRRLHGRRLPAAWADHELTWPNLHELAHTQCPSLCHGLEGHEGLHGQHHIACLQADHVCRHWQCCCCSWVQLWNAPGVHALLQLLLLQLQLLLLAGPVAAGTLAPAVDLA